jgi:hypothetical protein
LKCLAGVPSSSLAPINETTDPPTCPVCGCILDTCSRQFASSFSINDTDYYCNNPICPGEKSRKHPEPEELHYHIALQNNHYFIEIKAKEKS